MIGREGWQDPVKGQNCQIGIQIFPHDQLSVSLQTKTNTFVFDLEIIIFVLFAVVDSIVDVVEAVELDADGDETKELSLKIGIVWLILIIGYLKGGSP
jgi:hypothetical protein